MMTVAGAYLLIMTSLSHSGKTMVALPMPDMATCVREMRKFNDAASSQPIGAGCIDARPAP